ncbi:MAG: hypothetical protein ABSG73_04115 [Candidatus Aminicenantales bacterium]
MNHKQLIVMWGAIGIIVLMCLFPPWRFHLMYPARSGENVTGYKPGPYRLIWLSAPQAPSVLTDAEITALVSFEAGLDWLRLLFPIIIVVMLASGLIVTFHSRKLH